MVALPKTITSPTVAAIYAGYEKREAAEPRRGHLGASVIGRPCERQLWYAFRWAYQEQFKGRMLRLFQRGHREEDWFAADLRSTGAQVHSVDPRTGQQFRFSAVGGDDAIDLQQRGDLRAYPVEGLGLLRAATNLGIPMGQRLGHLIECVSEHA